NEILYGELKADFSWYPNAAHKIKFGLRSYNYTYCKPLKNWKAVYH
ncbi:unnamed protein product, partial [marine sediment metagenome]